MTEDFHKPFIKSMVIVAFVTIVSMISSRYIVNFYMNSSFPPAKTPEFTSQKSQEQIYSSVVE